MITNIQTTETYATLQEAINQLPPVFTQDYELVIGNGVYDVGAGATSITKNTGIYKLLIRGESKAGVLLSSSNITLIIAGGTTSNVTLKDFRISSGTTQSIKLTSVKNFTIDNVDMISTSGNFIYLNNSAGILPENFVVKNCSATTDGSTVLVITVCNNLTFLNNNFHVTRTVSGTTHRCIWTSTTFTGAFIAKNNTFGTTLGDSAIYITTSGIGSSVLIDKNNFKESATQLYVNASNTTDTVITVTDNLFESTRTYNAYIIGGNINILNNTFINNLSNNYCLRIQEIISSINIKNNIFYRSLTVNSTSFIYATYPVGVIKTLSTLNINNNLYYSPLYSTIENSVNGDITVWRPYQPIISFNSGTAITYSTLISVQADNSDLLSINSDPLFTFGANSTPYYYLSAESKAINAANTTLTLDTQDYRGYYRQDFYTDMGCYDTGAGVSSKLSNDPLRTPIEIIRRNDGAIFHTVQAGVVATDYSVDEDIYLDINNPLTNSNWISAGNLLPQGRIMYVQPHIEMVGGENGKAVCKDGVTGWNGLGTALSGVWNIQFKDIIFDAMNGTTPGLCGASISLGGARNLIFDGCEFRNGQHGFYFYNGQDITFKNCKFYNFYDRAVYMSSITNITFINCDFDYGNFATLETQQELYMTHEMFYISVCKDIKFINCNIVGSKYTKIGIRVRESENITIDGCTFSNIGNGKVIAVTNDDDVIRLKNYSMCNNIFKNNGNYLIDYTTMITYDNIENVKINNNTFYDNNLYYISLVYFSTSINIQINNNFVYHTVIPVSNTTNFIFNITTFDDNLICDNNYYVINSNMNFLRHGGPYYRTISTASVVGYDINSILIPYTSQLLSSYIDLVTNIPQVGSPLSTSGNYALAPNLDNKGKLKNITTVSIGACYYNSIENSPNLSPSLVYNLRNRTDNTVIPITTYPLSIMSLDDIQFNVSENINEIYNIKLIELIDNYTINTVVSVETIETDDLGVETLVTSYLSPIIGDVTSKLDTVTIIKNVSDNTLYTINYCFYSQDNNTTYISSSNPIPSDITVTWDKILISGIGFSFQFNLPYRYHQYQLVADKITNQQTFTTTHNPFCTAIQSRPVSSFKSDLNIIYLGDSVSVTNKSLEIDTFNWNIVGGGLNINNSIDNIITFTPTSIGEISVTLSTTNSTPINSIKVVPSLIKVLSIPSLAVVNFDVNKQVIHRDEVLMLCGTLDVNNNKKITRFNSLSTVFKWKIITSETRIVYESYIGENVSIDISNYPLGSYDIELIIFDPISPLLGKNMLERRYVTVLPSWKNSRILHYNLTYNDSFIDNSGVTYNGKSAIYGNRTTGVGCLNSDVILPGDVIVLDGITRDLRINNLVGTAENPIMIIAKGTNSNTFKVNAISYSGIALEYCQHVIISGIRNYDETDIKYSFEIRTDKDPAYYIKSPGTMLISVRKRNTDIQITGVECIDSKFDCISAKESPVSTDPSGWRNDPTGGFVFNNLNIHHNLLRDSRGEGVYLGHFSPGKIGSALNSQGVLQDYYAQILKNTKVYRNIFLNNGFDAVQLNNCYEGGEIHNNDCINPGWRRVFGQNSAMSIAYVGDLYNNYMERHITYQLMQGTLRIFNNIIKTTNAAIYIKNAMDPFPYWDINVSPQIISQTAYSGDNAKVFIYNNAIGTLKGSITYNGESNMKLNTLYVANNVIIVPDSEYTSTAIKGVFTVSLMGIKAELTNSGTYTYDSGTTLNKGIFNHTELSNMFIPESRLSEIGISDYASGIFSITKNSTLYQTGVYLNGIYNLNNEEVRDKNGCLLPSFDGKYPIGPYDFDTLNSYIDPIKYSNTISGNITNLSNLVYLNVNGDNTLSGDVSNLTNLEYCKVIGKSNITYPNVTNLTKLHYLSVSPNTTLTQTNIDQILSDFWVNRNYTKPGVERTVNILGSQISNAPTNTGLQHKLNLLNYTSPGTASPLKWHILTR